MTGVRFFLLILILSNKLLGNDLSRPIPKKFDLNHNVIESQKYYHLV